MLPSWSIQQKSLQTVTFAYFVKTSGDYDEELLKEKFDSEINQNETREMATKLIIQVVPVCYHDFSCLLHVKNKNLKNPKSEKSNVTVTSGSI